MVPLKRRKVACPLAGNTGTTGGGDAGSIKFPEVVLFLLERKMGASRRTFLSQLGRKKGFHVEDVFKWDPLKTNIMITLTMVDLLTFKPLSWFCIVCVTQQQINTIIVNWYWPPLQWKCHACRVWKQQQWGGQTLAGLPEWPESCSPVGHQLVHREHACGTTGWYPGQT